MDRHPEDYVGKTIQHCENGKWYNRKILDYKKDENRPRKEAPQGETFVMYFPSNPVGYKVYEEPTQEVFNWLNDGTLRLKPKVIVL
jgi:hypothetical protein